MTSGSTLGGTARVAPLPTDAMGETQDIADRVAAMGGYVPTSFRIMAHKPALLRAFAALAAEVLRGEGEVPPATRWLVAHAASSAAGCRYCQAHTAANGHKSGVPSDKVERFMDYDKDPAFTPAERAAITLGFAAGRSPNETSEAHFAELRQHFTDTAIVEIVAVISLFGWLNRWNDTMASDLEPAPLAFASDHLVARGWSAGKHLP
jgi:uncharacterized peroxidase-related enzyme